MDMSYITLATVFFIWTNLLIFGREVLRIFF